MKPGPLFPNHNLRIAALQCNFEKNTFAVPDRWKEMGFNTEQLFHPIADCYSACYDPKQHRRLLERYVRKAHAKGIRIILYLNGHILGPKLRHKMKTWSARDEKDNIVYLYDGQYPSICVNSPFRDYFFGLMREVAKLDVDGLFLDGPYAHEGGCRCVSCRAFHQELFGRPIEGSPHIWEFRAESKDRFLSEAHGLWKRLCPDRPFYMNLGLTHAGYSCIQVEKALAYNDIVGTEGGFFPYGPARDSYLYKAGFAAKLLEAAAPEKPRVIFMAGDHKPWSWWMHSPQETIQCVASTYANGANAWWGLHNSTRLLDTPSGAAARDIFRFTARHAAAMEGTRSCADIALYYSFATDRHYSSSAEASDFYGNGGARKAAGKPEDAIRGWHSLLTESHLPFDLITEIGLSRERLARYRFLALPGTACMAESEATLISEWVRNGGTLFAEFDATRFDEKGGLRRDFRLGDLLGVRAGRGFLEHKNFNYFAIADSPLRRVAGNALLLPLPLKTLPVRALKSARVLARSLREMAGRYVALTRPEAPFLVTRAFGEGRSYYCAGSFGEMYHTYRPLEYRHLLDYIIRRHASPRVTLAGAPDTVELTVREKEGRLFAYLVQFGQSVSRPHDVPPPIRDLRIVAGPGRRFAKVISLKSGKALRLAGNGRTALLPELHQFDLVKIETGR